THYLIVMSGGLWGYRRIMQLKKRATATGVTAARRNATSRDPSSSASASGTLHAPVYRAESANTRGPARDRCLKCSIASPLLETGLAPRSCSSLIAAAGLR